MVKIKRIEDDLEPITIDLGNDLTKTTMAQVRQKIYLKYPNLKESYENAIFSYSNDTINEQTSLANYNINDNSVIEAQKGFNPNKNYGLKLIHRPDSITGYDDDQLRAEVYIAILDCEILELSIIYLVSFMFSLAVDTQSIRLH